MPRQQHVDIQLSENRPVIADLPLRNPLQHRNHHLDIGPAAGLGIPQPSAGRGEHI
jgi:hypothetical protein